MSETLRIAYPVPLDSGSVSADFEPAIRRWCASFCLFEPGCKVEVLAMCCNSFPPESIRKLFVGIPTTFVRYDGGGCDGGASQYAARLLGEGFMVGCTTRTYFHAPGWGKAMLKARSEKGPGLFSSAASNEVRPHLCFRFYGLDAEDFLEAMPDPITCRQNGTFTEQGNSSIGNLTQWMDRNGGATCVVLRDGVYDRKDWFTAANRFRNGDQTNMLAWDRHSDIYHYSGNAEKERLATITEGA